MEFQIILDRNEQNNLKDALGQVRILGKSVNTSFNSVFLRVDGTEEDFTYFRIMLGKDKVWIR